MSELRSIDPGLLKPGRWQNRRDFDQEQLEALAESIREQGVVQPIVARFDRRDGLYEIVAGERRWRAALLAQEAAVPVVVRNDLKDHEARLICLIENLQRQDLNPIEEAEGYRELLDAGLTQKEAAEKLGISRSHIANMVRLLGLPKPIQRHLIDGRLDYGHVKPILPLSEHHQVRIADMAIRLGWNVRKIEQQAAAAKQMESGGLKGESSSVEDPNARHLIQRIQEAAGLPAKLVPDKKKPGAGSLTFRFHSPEELEGFLDRLLRT